MKLRDTEKTASILYLTFGGRHQAEIVTVLSSTRLLTKFIPIESHRSTKRNSQTAIASPSHHPPGPQPDLRLLLHKTLKTSRPPLKLMRTPWETTAEDSKNDQKRLPACGLMDL